ncbi:MAG: ABC transporter ATP-binding protein [Phycisphaeraceae bacterium]
MTPIHIDTLRKTFDKTVAVDGITLNIKPGSLFFLLGPSGCGKTTLLRMIAGFTEPTSGTIHFGEQDVTWLPPHKRNCGMVFQGYALWPHMTVAQNVAFGLNVRKIDKAQTLTRVADALKLVQMAEYGDRKPNQLSGGQQQRVALARALVIKPTVLLLDEPLSNLDAKLRIEMRGQIKSICKQAGTTAVYVTHDQKEALSMADEVALLKNGKVMQSGPARELYDRPRSRFVADFLGETNFIAAKVVGREDGQVLLEGDAGKMRSTVFPDDLAKEGNVTCCVRPEAIRILSPKATDEGSDGANTFTAKRLDTTYLGEVAQHHLLLPGKVKVTVFELNPKPQKFNGDEVRVGFDPEDVVVLKD